MNGLVVCDMIFCPDLCLRTLSLSFFLNDFFEQVSTPRRGVKILVITYKLIMLSFMFPMINTAIKQK